jgi:hypothetical protein
VQSVTPESRAIRTLPHRWPFGRVTEGLPTNHPKLGNFCAWGELLRLDAGFIAAYIQPHESCTTFLNCEIPSLNQEGYS